MKADDVLGKLSIKIYEPPLSAVREESGFPSLENPLHLAVLLLDCDTEVMMNGILGFLENRTGRHLLDTIEALRRIGASEGADQFQAVWESMLRHGVTWQRLRADFTNIEHLEITSFRKLHGGALNAFATEIGQVFSKSSLFEECTGEDAYGAFCQYLDIRLDALLQEIKERNG